MSEQGMSIEEYLDAIARRASRSLESPLGELIYEPVLDGPAAQVVRHYVGDFPCVVCRWLKKRNPERPRRHLQIINPGGAEDGAVYCTSCGWRKDEAGAYYELLSGGFVRFDDQYREVHR